MRGILVSVAVLALAACGQSGGSGKPASGGGGQSATITEGTINDAMIDLSNSESYGATSTVDESALVTKPDAPAKDKDAPKPKDAPKDKAEKPKREAEKPAKSDEAAGEE